MYFNRGQDDCSWICIIVTVVRVLCTIGCMWQYNEGVPCKGGGVPCKGGVCHVREGVCHVREGV